MGNVPNGPVGLKWFASYAKAISKCWLRRGKGLGHKVSLASPWMFKRYIFKESEMLPAEFSFCKCLVFGNDLSVAECASSSESRAESAVLVNQSVGGYSFFSQSAQAGIEN